MKHNVEKIIDLDNLYFATNKVSKAKNLQDVCDIIFGFIENIAPYNMIIIYEVDRKRNELIAISSRGSDVNKLKMRVPFKIGEGAVGWVAKTKKALLIEDALEKGQIQIRQFFNQDPIIRSFLAVPLIVGDKLKGILSMSSSKPKMYSSGIVQAVTIISNQAAAVLELNSKIDETTRFSNHILENINSGVLVVDNNLEVILYNKASEEITGYSCSEVLGKNINSLSFLEKDKVTCIYDGIEHKKTYFEEQGLMIDKNGTQRNIRFSTSILESDDGIIKGVICIFRDTTKMEILQQQIIRSEKLASIGRLTAGIAHEIRNPLLPIRTASQMLVKKMSTFGYDQQVTELINIIAKESERLSKFLNQFMDINRTSSELAGETLLKEAVQEILVLIKSDIKSSGIDVIIDFANETKLRLNKDILIQILLNLFLNSIDSLKKSSKRGAKLIKLSVQKSDSEVILKFSDNGNGIKSEYIDKVFDPFFTTKEIGTGLGLYVAYNLVTAAKGKIWAESTYGEYVTFTIVMPGY